MYKKLIAILTICVAMLWYVHIHAFTHACLWFHCTLLLYLTNPECLFFSLNIAGLLLELVVSLHGTCACQSCTVC